MPHCTTPIRARALSFTGRIVYLYGGRSKSGVALDDLHMLDLEANFWSCPKPKSEKSTKSIHRGDDDEKEVA